MLYGTFDTSAANPLKRFQIDNDAQGATLTMNFAGRANVGAGVSPAVTAQMMQDFTAAYNGKINLQYVTTGVTPAVNVPMVLNQSFTDIAEIVSALGGSLKINQVGVTSNYVAVCKLPFSHTGTVPLGANANVIIEFESFTNASVLGGGGTFAAGTITVETYVSPTYSNNVIVVKSLPVITGQSANIDLTNVAVLAIPASTAFCTLYSKDGATHNLNAAGLPAYALAHTKNHINVGGLVAPYYGWVLLNVSGNTRSDLSLSAGNVAYTHYSVTIR